MKHAASKPRWNRRGFVALARSTLALAPCILALRTKRFSSIPLTPRSPSQKRLLQEAQERRRDRQAAERQQQQAADAAQRQGADGPPASGGAAFSIQQPIDEIISAVLAAVACPYSRLGLPLHAPRDACRRSYLQLALKLHPDKCVHPRAKEAFAAVEEAFRTVGGG